MSWVGPGETKMSWMGPAETKMSWAGLAEMKMSWMVPAEMKVSWKSILGPVFCHGARGSQEARNCCQTLYLETQRSLENRYTHQNDVKTGHRGRETQGS